MVVRLRLQRFGMTNHPFYRIVAADSRFPRDGRFIERVWKLITWRIVQWLTYGIARMVQSDPYEG